MLGISLVTVTDGNKIQSLEKMLTSVSDIVSEKVIVYQGSDREKRATLESMSDFCFQLTNKGNADPDRNFAYGLASNPWILALDDDEYLPDETKQYIAQVINGTADVVWFNFNNMVDNVSIKHILGDDPHPRLWRNTQPPVIVWPIEAHTFPQINSPRQIFTKKEVIHSRNYDDLVKRHESRKLAINPQNVALEENFLREVRKTLDKRDKK